MKRPQILALVMRRDYPNWASIVLFCLMHRMPMGRTAGNYLGFTPSLIAHLHRVHNSSPINEKVNSAAPSQV